jgi:hypothetical protein
LTRCDAEADVVLMTQPSYPQEHALAGVAIREDCHEESDDRRDEPGAASGDVVLVEGRWLRYGTVVAWAAARSR